jgi:choline dehydrogenase-like flavoprotein
MIRDASTVEDGAVLDCDVCIIGTGAAGVTAALGLAGGGRRLVVLEAGGTAEVSASELALETTDLPVSPSSRQTMLGGTTNSWWGKVALLDGHDFEARDWVAASGWPIGRDDLVEHYRAACALLGVPDLTSFTIPEPSGGKGALLRSDVLEPKPFFWTRRPLNFGTVHRRRLGDAPGVTTLLNATVTMLHLGAGRRVAELEVAGPAGRTFRVRPSTTILAAGGIENARLLLESGIGNDQDQVGRYYMDHPRGPFGAVELTAAASRLSPAYWSGKRWGRSRFRLGVSLSPEAQAELRVMNSYVNLSPVYPGEGVRAVRALYRHGPKALADGKTRRALASGVPDVARYLLFKRYGRGRIAALTIDNYTEQEPRAENRITLSDRRDASGRRIPVVAYSLSDLDRHTVRTLHDRLDAELRSRGMGRLTSALPADDEPWPIRNDAAHHMGGTRMGTDPRTSVVDADAKVHGAEGLYVAGSSVFPTGGAANPTLTIVALAARLAGHIRSKVDRLAPVVARQSTTAAPAVGDPRIRAEGR